MKPLTLFQVPQSKRVLQVRRWSHDHGWLVTELCPPRWTRNGRLLLQGEEWLCAATTKDLAVECARLYLRHMGGGEVQILDDTGEISERVLTVKGTQDEVPDTPSDERAKGEHGRWRERAAMLERSLDEAADGGRSASRRQKRRRRRAAPGFELGKVRWGRISKITTDGAFVRINGVDWPVNVPEFSWGDIPSPARIVSVGDTVGVKTLSTPAHSRHPFLLLI